MQDGILLAVKLCHLPNSMMTSVFLFGLVVMGGPTIPTKSASTIFSHLI
jgi:hypothetical protein